MIDVWMVEDAMVDCSVANSKKTKIPRVMVKNPQKSPDRNFKGKHAKYLLNSAPWVMFTRRSLERVINPFLKWRFVR